MARQLLTERAVLCGVVLLLGACRTPGARDPDNSLREYEQAQYDGKNVCQLMQAEAIQSVARLEGLDVFAKYRDIVARERDIFASLIDVIEGCDAGVGEGEGGRVLTSEHCTNIDRSRLVLYKSRLSEIDGCPELQDTDLPENLRRVAAEEVCRQIHAQLPDWFDESCRVDEIKLRNKGADVLASACDYVAAMVKDKTPVELQESILLQCSSQVVGDVCGRLGAAGANLAAAQVSTNPAILDEAKADLEAARNFGLENIQEFAHATASCVGAYGVQKLKELAVDYAVTGLSRTTFAESIKTYQKWIKDGAEQRKANALRNLALAGCKVGANIVANQIDQTPPRVPSDACSPEALKVDRHQIAQCTRTAGDACELASGRIDLSNLVGVQSHELEKVAALSMVEGGLEAACQAGGTASSVACSTIAKSATYIRDALQGKSNPWADCLGTPKLGACVGQKWFEWSSGVRVADFSVGIEPERVDPSTGTRSRKLCWCWQKCFKDYTWPRSNVFYHKEFDFTVVPKGDAGVRSCNAREATHKNKGKRDGVPIMYQYTDCDVVNSRQGPAGAYLPPGGTIEIYWDNKWGKYRIPPEGYTCDR